MNLGNLISEAQESLGRAVIGLEPGPIIFWALALTLVFLVDYKFGVTHHYDTSAQIEEIEALQKLDPNASQAQTIDSLYAGVLEEMEERQEPLLDPQNPLRKSALTLQDIPNEGLYRILEVLMRLLLPSFGFLGYALYAMISDSGLDNPYEQAIGSGLVAGLLAFLGLTVPVPEGLTGAATLLFGLQVATLIAMVIYGRIRQL